MKTKKHIKKFLLRTGAVTLAIFSVLFFVAPISRGSVVKQFNYQGRLTDASDVSVADGAYDVVFNIYNSGDGGSSLWSESWTSAALWTETGTTTLSDGNGSNGCPTGTKKIVYTTDTHESTLAAGQYLWNTTIKENALVQGVDTGGNVICVYTPTSTWSNGDDLTNRIYVKGGIFSIMLGSINPLTVDFTSGTYYLGVKIGVDNEMRPLKEIGSVPQAINANNLSGDGYINIDNTSPAQDAANINYNPASGTHDALSITYGSGGGTGTAVNVTQAGTGYALRVNDDGTFTDSTPFVVDASGNVGIGTTSPVNLFNIEKSSYVSNLVVINNGTTGAPNAYPNSYTPTLVVNTGETSGSRPLWFGYKNGSNWDAFLTSGACGAFSQMCLDMGSGSSVYTALENVTTTLNIGGGDDGNFTNVLFKNSGNVGIGTTSAGAKLDVIGGSIRTDNQLISTIATGTAPLSITSTTAVTNLNADLLDGNHAAAFQTALTNPVTGTGSAGYLTRWATSSTVGSSVVYDTGANVGIGTTLPSQLFQVNNSGSSAFVVTSGGNVGIGTTSPGAKLEVSGDIYLSTGADRTISVPSSSSLYNLTVAAPGRNCFLAGTKVSMSDGSHKNIEEVKLGEEVVSFDESKKETVISKVTRVFHHSVEEMVDDHYLIIDTKNGAQIQVTPNHRFYSGGIWKAAGELIIGDSLLNDNNEVDKVAKIQKVYQKVPTYNLEIEKYHVYFAEGILVHNFKVGANWPGGNLYLAGGAAGGGDSAGGNAYIYGGAPYGSAAYGNVILANNISSSIGKVGVGTTAPGNKLSVSGGVGIGTTAPGSAYLSTAAPDGGLIVEGNVGIGTTSPGQKLDIIGGSIRTDNQLISTVATGTAPLSVSSTTTVTNLSADYLDGHDTSYFQTALTNPVTGTGSAGYLTRWATSSTVGSSVIYDTGTNVGIGTTLPSQLFQVNSSGSTAFVVTSGGNVGIGTTSPLVKLTVFGTDNALRLAYDGSNYSTLSVDSSGDLSLNSSDVAQSSVILGNGGAQDTSVIYYGSSQSFYAGLDDTDSVFKIGSGQVVGTATAMSVTSGGNVGIGTITPGAQLSVVNDALSTSSLVNLSSASAGLTSGSLLYVSTDTTGAVATNGVVSINATGAYTSTSNMGLLSVLANSTTAGTIQRIQGDALTTGRGLHISSAGTGLTSGSLLYVTSATTGAVATNGVVSINATGAYTSTSNAGLLNILANSTLTGTIENISGNALTSGTMLNLSSSSTAFTGTMANVTLSGNNASNTGTLEKITVSGASSVAVPLMLTNAGAGLSFRVNDDGTDTDSTPFVVDASGNVGVGTTAPGAMLDLGQAGATLGVLRLAGNTSGNVTVQPAAAAGTWTMTLPTTGGTNGYFLQTNGSGTTTWAAAGTGTRWDQISAPTAALSLTMPAGDETTFTEQSTTQTGFTWTSSTITSGMVGSFALTGSSAAATAANSGSVLSISSSTTGFTAATQTLAAIYSSGANSNSGVTVQGLSSSVVNTGTTSKNIAAYFSASGAATNYGLIVNAGNVGIGTTAPTDALHVVGNVFATTGLHIGVNQDANLFSTSSHGSASTSMYIGREYINTTLSDRRAKENITPSAVNALNIIGEFQVVDFDWLEGNPDRNSGRATGLIAQDVYEYLPQVVMKPDDPDNMWSVKYQYIVPYLIKGIQEQQLEISGISNDQLSIHQEVGQISNQFSTLNDQTVGVDDKLNIISSSLTNLDTRTTTNETDITNLKSQLASAQTKLETNENNLLTYETSVNDLIQSMTETENMLTEKVLNHEDRIKALEDKMATLSVESGGTLPANVVTQDTDGNVTLAGLFKAKAVQTDGVVAGSYAVKSSGAESATLGEAEITAIQNDANKDGIDDKSGTDGKSVFVPTKAVTEASQVFVTSKVVLDQPLVVTKIKPGEGFTVAKKDVTDENINFSWWVVDNK